MKTQTKDAVALAMDWLAQLRDEDSAEPPPGDGKPAIDSAPPAGDFGDVPPAAPPAGDWVDAAPAAPPADRLGAVPRPCRPPADWGMLLRPRRPPPIGGSAAPLPARRRLEGCRPAAPPARFGGCCSGGASRRRLLARRAARRRWADAAPAAPPAADSRRAAAPPTNSGPAAAVPPETTSPGRTGMKAEHRDYRAGGDRRRAADTPRLVRDGLLHIALRGPGSARRGGHPHPCDRGWVAGRCARPAGLPAMPAGRLPGSGPRTRSRCGTGTRRSP